MAPAVQWRLAPAKDTSELELLFVFNTIKCELFAVIGLGTALRRVASDRNAHSSRLEVTVYRQVNLYMRWVSQLY